MTDREEMIETMNAAEMERCFVTSCGSCKHKDEGCCLLGLYADALIAAEIGDVRVAERAFKEICIDKVFGEDDGLSIKWMWEFYKARAERKLTEEDKR